MAMVPRLHRIQPRGVQVEPCAETFDRGAPQSSPESITETHPTNAPAERGSQGRQESKLLAEDEVAGKGQQRFIWHGQPDNPEPEQTEKGQIAIMGNPVHDRGHPLGRPPTTPVVQAQGFSALGAWTQAPTARSDGPLTPRPIAVPHICYLANAIPTLATFS
jgi:hypothetical protein